MSVNAEIFQFLLNQQRSVNGIVDFGTATFYDSGTSNIRTIWLDSTKSVAAANPYSLSSNGTAELYGDGLYRVVIKDSSGTIKFDIDELFVGENPVSSVPISTSSVTWQGLINYSIISVDDILGLINTVAPSDGDLVSVSGFFFTAPESNPRSGGQFIWQAGLNKNLANGGTIIDPDNIGGFDGTVSTRDSFLAAQGAGVGSGCWVRQYNGPVIVSWFGTVGDDVTDDTVAIQSAVDSGKNVYVPIGTYNTGFISTNKDIYIFGDGPNKSIFHNPTQLTTFRADSESITDQISFRCEGLQFLSDVDTLGFSEQKHQLQISGVTGDITNCSFIGFYGDGVYLGSSHIAATERHNKDFTIEHNFFDGINKDNRNAISVIDGEAIHITNNTITRCSRTDMPGPIDVEPNDNVFAVIKDITVLNNNIYDCGGNVGYISVVRPGTILTTQPSGVYVRGNYLKDAPTSGVAFSAGASSQSFTDIVISDNVVTGSRPFNLNKFLSGVVIKGNTFTGTAASLLAFDVGNVVKNVVISDNIFNSMIDAISVVSGTLSTAIINGNVFNYTGVGTNYGITIQSTSTKDNIHIKNNTFTGAWNKTVSDTAASGSPETCSYQGNFSARIQNTFKAFINDQPTEFIGTTANPFNSTTLPSVFPYGVSNILVNGDTGVPNVGGYQGVLECHCFNNNTKFIYQLYYPANNTSTDSVYIRKGDLSTDTWSAWFLK